MAKTAAWTRKEGKTPRVDSMPKVEPRTLKAPLNHLCLQNKLQSLPSLLHVVNPFVHEWVACPDLQQNLTVSQPERPSLCVNGIANIILS